MSEISHLEIYFKEIYKNKPLSTKEEKELIQRIRKGDEKAKDKLVKANLRFVVSVAKRYQNQGMDLADIINEGNIGLLKSIKQFKEEKDFKLITYAVWWIRQHILLAMCRHSRAVTIPLISVAYIKKVREIYRKLEQKLKRNITTEEISLELKKSAKLVKRIQQTDIPAISLNTTIFDDDIELIDTIADKEEKVDEKLVRFVEKLINCLKDEREKDIIRMYFGLSDNDYGTGKTLEEISKKFGISRERVRQIKFDALKSLEKASEKLNYLI